MMDTSGNNKEFEIFELEDIRSEIDEPLPSQNREENKLSKKLSLEHIKEENKLKQNIMKFMEGFSLTKFCIICMIVLVIVDIIATAFVEKYDRYLIEYMFDIFKMIIPLIIGYAYGKNSQE